MKMLIAGKDRDAFSGKTIDVINPATGEVIDTVPAGTVEDAEEALSYAADNKNIWACTSVRERADMLIKATDLINQERNQLAEIITKETGKVIWQAQLEVDSAIGLFKGYAEKAKYCYDTVLPSEHDMITVKREPLGVVACIIPYNFPIELYSHKVAPALAAGNSVIVKPASDTPLSAIYLTDLLHRAGIPKEALQVITGSGSVVGDYIAKSNKINAISVTGSTQAGLSIYSAAAKNLTRAFMELGGNDALIVLDDADVDKAVDTAVKCRTYCAGQVCSATKRFIVDNKIKSEFTEKLVNALKQVPVGNPFKAGIMMGSLTSENAALEVEEQVAATIKQGAECILGGKKGEFAFFPCTVLSNVTKDMDIAKDMEIFGPVYPIIGFDTEDEAVEIANQSSFGLSGGVCTENISRGYKVAEKIDSGSVIVNPPFPYRTFDIPFGGHKMSGIGNEGIFATLEEMTQLKTVVVAGMK